MAIIQDRMKINHENNINGFRGLHRLKTIPEVTHIPGLPMILTEVYAQAGEQSDTALK